MAAERDADPRLPCLIATVDRITVPLVERGKSVDGRAGPDGWRAHGGPGGFLGAMGLLLLFRFAMLWIGIHLALLAGRPELLQAVQILVWPVGFLSNAFAAHRSMPDWLGTAVEWNPMSHTAPAVRDLLGGPGGEPGHAGAAVLWPLALPAVFLPWRGAGSRG